METATRFNQTVDFYDQYRPTYPIALLEYLQKQVGLQEGDSVADIGSGTGKLTSLLVNLGLEVYAVEPNEKFREIAAHKLGQYANFHNVPGDSEVTHLPDYCVKLITVAQAFHWFKPIPTKTEFLRILQPQGYLALIWNNRLIHDSPFMRAYEALMEKYGINYHEVAADRFNPEGLRDFFAPAEMTVFQTPHEQILNWEGLVGRTESISYLPKKGAPRYAEMMQDLQAIHDACAVAGKVVFLYETKVYFGMLKPR